VHALGLAINSPRRPFRRPASPTNAHQEGRIEAGDPDFPFNHPKFAQILHDVLAKAAMNHPRNDFIQRSALVSVVKNPPPSSPAYTRPTRNSLSRNPVAISLLWTRFAIGLLHLTSSPRAAIELRARCAGLP
jgi:hypothetical protein